MKLFVKTKDKKYPIYFGVNNCFKIEKILEQNKIYPKKLIVIYDRNIPIAITVDHSLDKFTSSRSLQKEFKRTISRLYELTSKE